MVKKLYFKQSEGSEWAKNFILSNPRPRIGQITLFYGIRGIGLLKRFSFIESEEQEWVKKIEFKDTVFESCANYYEKSVDFMDCVRNILKNDLYKWYKRNKMLKYIICLLSIVGIIATSINHIIILKRIERIEKLKRRK